MIRSMTTHLGRMADYTYGSVRGTPPEGAGADRKNKPPLWESLAHYRIYAGIKWALFANGGSRCRILSRYSDAEGG